MHCLSHSEGSSGCIFKTEMARDSVEDGAARGVSGLCRPLSQVPCLTRKVLSPLPHHWAPWIIQNHLPS